MISLRVQSFLDFITYSKLFDNVSLINYPEILSALQSIDDVEDKAMFHLEGDTLWLMDSWIEECRRRKFLTRLECEVAQDRNRIVVERVDKSRRDNLTKDVNIREAIKSGDSKLIMQQLIKKYTTK